MTLPLRLGLAAAGLLAAFTIAASALLLLPTGIWRTYDVIWWPFAWWYLAWWWPTSTPVLVSGGVPLAVVGVVAGKITYKKSQKVHGWPLRLAHDSDKPAPQSIEAGTGNYGRAHFSAMEENQERWPEGSAQPYVGMVVGEAYNPRLDEGPFNPRDRSTWGRGGVAPLLIDDLTQGSTHSIEFAGSGGLKTLSTVIPNLLTFQGPVVCMDPKQRLAEMVRDARQAMGKRVVVLEPGRMGFNAIDWIDPGSPLFGIDIDNVIETVCGHTSRRDQKSAFFKDRGKDIAKALLSNMLWDPSLPSTLRSLAALREQISEPAEKLAANLSAIYRTSPSPIARDLAGSLASDLDKSPEMFAGFHSAVVRDTAWLGDPAYAQLVSGDAFKTTDILAGDTDVFIALPLKSLEANAAPARSILGALMNAVYDANGKLPCGRVLFEIEEAKRIGRMNILSVARDAGRELGITVEMIYQSPGQMEEDWGKDGKQAWYDNARRSYASVNSVETADEIARALGKYGVVNLSESQNVGSSRARPMAQRSRSWGRNVTHSWSGRQLMLPEEIIYNLRSDTKIVIPQPGTGWPAICGRAFVPRRPEMLARVRGLY